MTRLFQFGRRIPQGASLPFQERLTTFPFIRVKKIILEQPNWGNFKERHFWPSTWTRFEFSVFGFIFERFLALWIDFLNCVICPSIVLSSLPASFSGLESGPFDWLLISLANRTSSSLCFSCISSNLSPKKWNHSVGRRKSALG